MSYSITFKESIWRDLNKIDKHQVKIIKAKIEDLLPGGVRKLSCIFRTIFYVTEIARSELSSDLYH